jgi:hypothetical protein
MKCKIADFVIEFNNKYEYLSKQCAEFAYCDNASSDIVVHISDEDIRKERLSCGDIYPLGYIESICTYRKLCLQLPLKDALLLHASVISCEDRGIAFLARSGVGKTTHTRLWEKIYGKKVKIINGDKPIIRFFDNVPFAYGTPWAGKENYYLNEKVKLSDICFLERGVENKISKITVGECFNAFMHQVLRPSDPKIAFKNLELVEKLLLKCNLWKIQCNMNDDAALVSHDGIFSEDLK